MTSDSILNTFLEVLCTTHQMHYLSTFFCTIIKRDKTWNDLQEWFTTGDPPSPSKPSLQSDKILIPCHVQGIHWVGVVRRIIKNQVWFLYADDLNQQAVEADLKYNLSTYADPAFYPRDAIWLNCKNITFRPHSNECGPRTLLALAVMSLHPDPDEHILLPLMHGNLAQITRTWIAESLLLGVVHIPDLPLDPLANMSNCSTPAYLFSWKERPQATYNEAVPRRCKETQEAITKSGKAHCTSTKKIGSTCLPDIQTVHQNRHPNKPQPKPQPDLKPASVNQAPITPHTEPKQKVRTKKLVKPPDQPSLLDMNFTKDKPSEIGIVDYETWGHTPVFIDRDSVFRIVLQNPRGLKLSGDLLNTQYSFAICKSMEAGAICLPETNTNWGHKSSHNSLKSLLSTHHVQRILY
jgi:hypothetical protein